MVQDEFRYQKIPSRPRQRIYKPNKHEVTALVPVTGRLFIAASSKRLPIPVTFAAVTPIDKYEVVIGPRSACATLPANCFAAIAPRSSTDPNNTHISPITMAHPGTLLPMTKQQGH